MMCCKVGLVFVNYTFYRCMVFRQTRQAPLFVDQFIKMMWWKKKHWDLLAASETGKSKYKKVYIYIIQYIYIYIYISTEQKSEPPLIFSYVASKEPDLLLFLMVFWRAVLQAFCTPQKKKKYDGTLSVTRWSPQSLDLAIIKSVWDHLDREWKTKGIRHRRNTLEVWRIRPEDCVKKMTRKL